MTSLICGVNKEMITNKLIYKTDSQTQKTNLRLLGERMGAWDGQVHTATFKMGNQQGPAVQHMELCLMYVPAWMGRRFGGEWIFVYVWLSPFAVT